MHSRLVEHYVRTSDDLTMLGDLESVCNLAICSIDKKIAFPGSQLEFSVVIFQYEGIRLASKNPQFVVIRLVVDP